MDIKQYFVVKKYFSLLPFLCSPLSPLFYSRESGIRLLKYPFLTLSSHVSHTCVYSKCSFLFVCFPCLLLSILLHMLGELYSCRML